MYIIGIFEDEYAKIGKALARAAGKFARTVLIDKKSYPRGGVLSDSARDVLIFSSPEIFHFSELYCDIFIPALPNRLQNVPGIKSRITVCEGDNLRSCPVFCDEIITCGNSPRDTLTLSSMHNGRAIFSLQREIVSLDGNVIRPCELEFDCDEHWLPSAMLTAAALHAMDLVPESGKIPAGSSAPT